MSYEKRYQSGTTLIEVMVAIVIFSVGVIAMIGLQSVSIGNMAHGKYRTDASFLANRLLAQMMIDKANVANYADSAGTASTYKTQWLADVAAALPRGSATVTLATGSVATVTVSWRNPDEQTAHTYTAIGQIAF